MSFVNGICGSVSYGGSGLIPCTSVDVAWKQTFLVYDHIYGLMDTASGGGGDLQPQKNIGRPGPRVINGSINFPLILGGDGLIGFARTAGMGNVDVKYNNSLSKSFPNCRTDQYSLSVSAGGTVDISVSVVGGSSSGRGGMRSNSSSISSVASSRAIACDPLLVTWSEVSISGVGDVQAFSLQVSNNCRPIYLSSDPSLDPYEIRVGTQSVTGSITIYGVGQLDDLSGKQSLAFSAGGMSFVASVIYEPVAVAGVAGPVLTTIPFVGTEYALGQ